MKLAYIELDEKPDRTISHPDFEYRLTAFTTRNNHLAEAKLVELHRLGAFPICVKYEGKYYIYIKVRDDVEDGKVSSSVPIPSPFLPKPLTGGDSKDGVNVSSDGREK